MKLGDPKSTFVIAVGIESYDFPEWNLHGPAMDALFICKWVLEQGVPGGNIQLFLNFAEDENEGKGSTARRNILNGLRKSLADQRVVINENPTRFVLDDALSQTKIEKLCSGQFCTFWFYWSGHGVTKDDGSGDRCLLTCDASKRELRTINVSHYAKYLSGTPEFARLKKQIFIVDACGIFLKGELQPISTDRGKFRETGAVGHEQIYSSADGQKAIIPSGEEMSLFTSRLLEQLQKRSLRELDTDELWQVVKEKVDQSNQPLIVRRFGSDGSADVADGRSPLLGRRIRELDEILRKTSALPLDVLLLIFRQLTQATDENVPKTASDITNKLNQLVTVLEYLSNCEAFAVRLSHFIEQRLQAGQLSDSTREELQKLNGQLSAWLEGSDGPSVNSYRTKLKMEFSGQSILFVDFDKKQKLMSVWIMLSNKTWRFLEKIQYENDDWVGLLRKANKRAIDEGMASTQACLELAISVTDLSQIPIGADISTEDQSQPQRIGRELPLTVHIRDRWENGVFKNNWNHVWERCQDLLDANGIVDWLDRRTNMINGRMPQPNAWAAIHDLEAQPWLGNFRKDVENGALWGIGCCPRLPDTARSTIEERANAHSLRQARSLAKELSSLGGNQNVELYFLLMADTPDSLPPISRPFRLPA